MSKKLKPCPFCGHDAKLQTIYRKLYSTYYVSCSYCGTTMKPVTTQEEAIAMWNIRELPKKEIRQAILQILADSGLNRYSLKSWISDEIRAEVRKAIQELVKENNVPILEHFVTQFVQELKNGNFKFEITKDNKNKGER